MATSTYGTPYVQGSDLVSAYPTVSSSLATRVDEVSYRGNGLNAQTGTTYTLVVGDAGKTITLSNASPVAVTLPQDSTADLPDGAVVTFYNLGAGTVTISQGTGATLQGGSITLVQYEVMTVIKLSANTYGRFDGGGSAGLAAATPTSIANSGGTATLSGNTVTFSGVSSVSLNGCFTSTYTNYRLLINIESSSVAQQPIFRLRAAGVDNSSANYMSNGADFASSSATTVQAYRTAGLMTSFYGHPVSSGYAFSVADILNPFATARTAILAMLVVQDSTDMRATNIQGMVNVTTSYDGFSFITASGTTTGTIRVYGYKS